MARRAASVLGIEGSQELVTQARDNAASNQVDNARFEMIDLFDETVAPWPESERIDKLLIDPPRSGAMAVVKKIGDISLSHGHRPRRIVYISCNPATLARDCQELVNTQGYRLTHAGVVDMFPHTAHIESIVVLDSD